MQAIRQEGMAAKEDNRGKLAENGLAEDVCGVEANGDPRLIGAPGHRSAETREAILTKLGEFHPTAPREC